MGTQSEQDKLERELKDSEARIQLIQTNIGAVQNELSLLNIIHEKLIENIKCLKENKIVAIAQEYKKAKEELQKTINRLAMLENDKNHFSKTYKDLTLNIKKIKILLAKLEKTKDNNVLQFKGKKNG